jgi:hypothetical protein
VKQRPFLSTVRDIMREFSALTGLEPPREAPKRYLWTDAFAVCNFLELYRQTGEEENRDLALRLVEQVHGVLGHHRQDDSRKGWISGLDEQEGRKHPTKGGLRIGKKLNERGSSENYDENLEWDRDGQYYHYLTKWMHALNRVSRVTGDAIYNTWAIELAKTAHQRFTYFPSFGKKKTMYWKMSIDLSRPLVRSMGQHDPLDGYITYHQLQASIAPAPGNSLYPDLEQEIADMAAICEGKSWATDDPLGIGGLLWDTYRVAQMIAAGSLEQSGLLDTLLESSLVGLASFAETKPWSLPADYRLAFRELGLAIGLRAAARLQGLIEKEPNRFENSDSIRRHARGLMQYSGLAQTIERFWLESANQRAGTWSEHREINMVTLATSLAPEGFILL